MLIDVFTEGWLAANAVVLVDEPDSHLHPDLLLRFGRALKKICNHTGARLVITSQRPAFASALGLAFSSNLEIGYVNSGGSFTTKRYNSRVEKLGSIFGGTAIAAELGIGIPLIVEGVDDEAIWAGLSRSCLLYTSPSPRDS